MNDLQDVELEEIARGVGNLKELASGMGRELEGQNELLDKIETRADKINTEMDTLNLKMKKTVDKVMKGDKFIVNCVLLVILLALASFIASYFV